VKEIIKIIVSVCIGFCIGYASQLWYVPPPGPGPDSPPAFRDALEEREFKRLLKKHGLEHDVNIIYEDHLGRYFIRNGKRCAFK